ncbi:bifunctional proline dehydrogenase/L-glutamate gamma-semialdehyde dehydrogenase [Propionimicrobium sp. PCR01-08-3]|uniref:bifunctional proline dehydrogenase/L-glutamate gamma-semialdehyde dehydrogenase n=1 Tax=Propionimicrobium sp. PCR01-08-3 TaxID=3052086 RepID=UPI00255CA52E|nr:bifunctional proline dehydrogenase/L-glutamate gamma-semialdehyde dehydrogenase [Propionimicrobium sp. PCR01-08-3]WIY82430.1 bifunctional proline dehydrogenase/L-glutamate gamma-semialdehyde dehydrogenase [Propionimicrobium sp. PCR01-08-3]
MINPDEETRTPFPGEQIRQAIELAEQTAQRWAEASAKYPENRAARLLADVLDDPDGLDYTVQFVDQVVRPEDMNVAARHLADLGARNPSFLPGWLRVPARVGGKAGRLVPKVAVPAARRVFQELVGDLVVDVTDDKLGPAIERLRADGSRLNINLLGEAVLGDEEADRRLADVAALMRRDDVDYVSLKVSAVTGPHNAWAYDEVVEAAVRKLTPVYAVARQASSATFINLDMEEYHDLDLTLDVFTQLLDQPENQQLDAGIVLQAYLPDALPAMERLQDWAARRRAKGGAPIKVRLVKGANLAMERVDADIHGWEEVTWESKRATDANYLRVLEWALTPERMANVHLGVAGHNLFTLAFAWELAGLRGVRDGIDVEMLSGMATQQAAAVREDVGDLLLYVPVVHPEEYDVAIAYLVRRLEENSASENFMARIFDIGTDAGAQSLERDRFRAAAAQWLREGDSRVHPNRGQDRATQSGAALEYPVRVEGDGWEFANTPDSDPALPANRAWAMEILKRVPGCGLGIETVEASTISDAGRLDETIARGAAVGRDWAATGADERAEILHRAGVELSRRRGELIEVAASELGKTIDQCDVEVSEATDFAHYYAEQALTLDALPDAVFTPAALTVVTPPWNFPLAIPMGGTVAALAAGSAVILKPASAAKRCAALLAECLWAAGVPRDVLQFVVPADHSLGEQLIRDTRVERVVLTGSSDTARMFRSWRPDLPLLAETSGKNAIIVTPSADFDLAVKDIVTSAFGHAGQKCSAASLVILVGSVASSKRFRNQLIDAVSSLVVDWPTNPAAQMGPLSEVPDEGSKLRRGLTQLEPGQNWVLKPRQLDDTERLWSPGIRAGVEPGSEYHMVEYFGPILGVMRAASLDEAIRWQNATAYGLTAGLQSLDAGEIRTWLDHVQAGNVYVNRGITGAIVRRQPFGGWKQSAVGAGAKAGGPNYLFGFGSFTPREEIADAFARPVELRKPQLTELLDAAAPSLDQADWARLERAMHSIEDACDKEFDVLHDPSALRSERNVLRYLPAAATIRAEAGAGLTDVVSVAGAALAVGEFNTPKGADGKRRLRRMAAGNPDAIQPLTVSVAEALPEPVERVLGRFGAVVLHESRESFVVRAKSEDQHHDGRIRLVGGDPDGLARDLDGDIDVAIWGGPVTGEGRVEVLPFVHEQAVSITNHRFGNPTPLGAEVLPASAASISA